MAKGFRNTRRLVLGLLFLPLLYAALLRCKVSPPFNLWRFRSHLQSRISVNNIRSNETAGTERNQHARFLLRRLVRGSGRRELVNNGVACVSDAESNFCVTSNAVRIATATAAEPATVFLTAGQRLPLDRRSFDLHPYARKTDALAMARTSPVRLLAGSASPPACDVVHPAPAVVFSTGGFAGNFFHDVNDVIIPLFLTAGPLRARARLVVVDFEPWWARKYGPVLAHLSASGSVVASSNSTPPDGRVHCFPAAVVGLKYHGNLACDPADAPGGVSAGSFRRFLRSALALGPETEEVGRAPVLVLLSRRWSRVLLNEEAVAGAAKEAGFEVVRATAERMGDVAEFAAVVGGCDVLMGVHGAGLTNMVFERAGAVVLQVVPWGLDWAAAAYYGRPAEAMGLRYVEYHVAMEESTLSAEYPWDDPVLADPWAINLKGYSVSRPIYTDGQNVTLDIERFRPTLLRARRELGR